MILDAAILIGVVVIVQLAQNKFPNLLFFPKGAVLFMPPEDVNEGKPKKKKQRQNNQIAVLKLEYGNVKEYPFSSQMNRVLMTVLTVTLFIIVRVIMNIFVSVQSSMAFYVLVAIIVYTIKLGIDTFFKTSYNKRACILIALSLNIAFMGLFITLESQQGLYDQRIKEKTIDYVKHLEIIFNKKLQFLTHRVLLGLIFILNFFVTISLMPAIIKFGNWYAKTLKQVYHDSEDKAPMPKRIDRVEADEKEQEARLKKQSKILIYKINVYMVCMVGIILLSHRYFLQYISEAVADIARGVLMIISCYCVCSTMGAAIEFNGSYAYKYVIDFFEQEDQEKRAELKKRVASYIYYVWFHYFQFIIRILMPLLLFLLVITWKYLFFDQPIISKPIDQRPLNTDIECGINTSQLDILENLYKCPVNVTLPYTNQHNFFLNGMIESIPQDLPRLSIQNNMVNYTVLTRSMVLQFSEHLFWYTTISLYAMTVLYIVFLRKTVYDM